MAGEVREALKGVEDAPGVAKVRVSGKTCGRLRAAAGLAALVLGMSLVLGSLGQTAGRLASGVDSGSFGSGWWSTDWQETPAFRQEVAQRLRAFLAMATGSDLEWWDTASGDTYIVSREGESFYEWGVTDTSSETAWVEENTATAAPDKHYAADKNLLYQVLGPERELLYSNVPAGAEISSSQNLPEGYNFLLVFRHGRILLRKDGEPVDVYGDGFYTEDSLWDVPGYENFTAGEDAADVTVYMALRQEPVPYLQLNSGGQTRFYDDFYGLYQHIREMQGFYLLRAVLCAAGAVCLIAAHFLRAERRRAEKKLAALTRRVPGEIWWLAAALAVLSMVFSTGFGGYSPFEFWYYGWVGPTVTDALRLAALLPANAPALLALVWALWLRHITRKNTEREQRRSLLRGLKNAFLARDLKLPVQKRLRRRSLVRNLALWSIMLTAVLCCVPVYEMLWNSSLTVICVFVPAFALIGPGNLLDPAGLDPGPGYRPAGGPSDGHPGRESGNAPGPAGGRRPASDRGAAERHPGGPAPGPGRADPQRTDEGGAHRQCFPRHKDTSDLHYQLRGTPQGRGRATGARKGLCIDPGKQIPAAENYGTGCV